MTQWVRAASTEQTAKRQGNLPHSARPDGIAAKLLPRAGARATAPPPREQKEQGDNDQPSRHHPSGPTGPPELQTLWKGRSVVVQPSLDQIGGHRRRNGLALNRAEADLRQKRPLIGSRHLTGQHLDPQMFGQRQDRQDHALLIATMVAAGNKAPPDPNPPDAKAAQGVQPRAAAAEIRDGDAAAGSPEPQDIGTDPCLCRVTFGFTERDLDPRGLEIQPLKLPQDSLGQKRIRKRAFGKAQ